LPLPSDTGLIGNTKLTGSTPMSLSHSDVHGTTKMNKLRFAFFIPFACAGLHAQCVPGGLAVVVPKSNQTDGLSMAQLRKLVLGDVHTWPDKNKVMLISTYAEGAVFKCLLSEAVRMTLPEYHKYLMNAQFRGDEPLHIGTVTSSANAIRNVAASAGSFAVVEASSIWIGGAVKSLASMESTLASHASQLPATAIMGLYRLRWQIELLFKRLKSLLHLDTLPSREGPTAKSWMLARLIAAGLAQRLVQPSGPLSPWGYELRSNRRAESTHA
jgi:hypothetical protein